MSSNFDKKSILLNQSLDGAKDAIEEIKEQWSHKVHKRVCSSSSKRFDYGKIFQPLKTLKDELLSFTSNVQDVVSELTNHVKGVQNNSSTAADTATIEHFLCSCNTSSEAETEALKKQRQLLNSLKAHITRFTRMIPKLFSDELLQKIVHAPSVLTSHQQGMAQLEADLSEVVAERDGLQADLDVTLNDLKTMDEQVSAEKAAFQQLQQRQDALVKESGQLNSELSRLKEDIAALQFRSENEVQYTAWMGSISFGLLCHACKSEEQVFSLCASSKMSELLDLAVETLPPFVEMYADTPDVASDTGEDESSSAQARQTAYVVSLCGTLTNLTAAPCGREYLVSRDSGRHLLDLLVAALPRMTRHHFLHLRKYILMILFNVTLNQKGVEMIAAKSEILRLTAWLAQEEKDTGNRRIALQLILSLMYEKMTASFYRQFLEVFTSEVLSSFVDDDCPEIRRMGAELLAALDKNFVDS